MVGEVIGVRKLQQRLNRIDQSTQVKFVAQSLRAAMVPMMKKARSEAPQGDEPHRTYKGRLVAPGFLKRNIKLRRMKFKDRSRVGYSLAARGEAFYGRLREAGTKYQKSDPWLGRAEQATGDRVTNDFKLQLLKRIQRARR